MNIPNKMSTTYVIKSGGTDDQDATNMIKHRWNFLRNGAHRERER